MDSETEKKMTKEHEIQRQITLKCSNRQVKLWKNDNGLAYQGKNITRSGTSAVIGNCVAFKYGLGVGTPDLIGCKSIVITPEMVGKRIAVFVGIEVKTEKGRLSEPQKNFLAMLKEQGGITGVARSVEEAREIIGSEIL